MVAFCTRELLSYNLGSVSRVTAAICHLEARRSYTSAIRPLYLINSSKKLSEPDMMDT